jgi:hypothetical protein
MELAQLELTDELKANLESQGYMSLRVIPNKGICGLLRLAYTMGLVVGIDETGYYGRYCYPEAHQAVIGLLTWNGEGDPSGEWLKWKGEGGDRRRLPDPITGEY